MRENTEQMQLPRFLWVPFELGRPFGAPNEPDFQRRVLRTALELLECEDGPVILEDFPDDAPVVTSTADAEGWSCPISFHPQTDHDAELVRETLSEIERLAPWHEVYVTERGHSAPPASGLTHEEVIRGLSTLANGVDVPEVSTDLPLQEWVRLGCDDLRTWYMEAAQGQPGRAQSSELREWFWGQTALARLIAGAAMYFIQSQEPGHTMFGRRVMVPRVYQPQLMPDDESIT
ncbi:MAG: hypothetical protein VCD00_07450 [Candidatus Hydrogenedentota bacterium]